MYKRQAVLKDVIPNAYFMIVGDGEQRREINQLIEELGLVGRVVTVSYTHLKCTIT